ncbi:MAG: hypothetical protein PHH60_04925 [Candidatus Margulisbacteria bacterium]|nr:hypothetical protein [Candidatus Margulisiibacteriota bacterium]
MLQVYLINTLIFCSVLLLLALIVGAIQLIMILVDVRKMTHEIKEKFMIVTSVFDIVSLIVGGLGSAKKKFKNADSSTIVGVVAGIKKGLQVLFKT